MAGKNWPLRSSDLKVKIVWLYYVESMTQEQIAELLGISRVKVMRTLAVASAEGIVITRINAATAQQIELERRLEEKWGLASAIVVPSPENGENLEKALGNAVASYLDQEMQSGMTLAIGGGATLYASVQFLEHRKLKEASVVALVGSLPHSRWINPSVVAARVAEVYEVDSYQITAPVILDEHGLRDLLWRQTELQSLQRRAAKADIALLTVGEVSEDATIFRHGIVASELIKPLRACGAVANILCYFVDKNGHLVDHEINQRVMSIDLGTVAAIERVVLAAGGSSKVAAMKAALKIVSASVLITDSQTATALLED
ncbi:MULTISPECIES: sugar-binding transcriptional regulator [Ochrobactrum]|uniref:Sugar-binding transcriptional regulator n=1 Tax=Ochrobactrum chromiisoli TaxID=2993941 RepID=A0ABT3QRQ5_9HYPH|nr:sugar-binding domain-containing protein [Ochrobactrum chromiisoli]MCX2698306.1 sugar-binding transcriptional regulator [Ochrobactrum chromiisoli]